MPNNRRNRRNRNNGGGNSNQNRNNTKPDEGKQVKNSVYDALQFDASNIFFNNILGSNISISDHIENVSLPTILVVPTAPNFTTDSNMLNIAATSVYTFVRHANSGRANYESSDLMLYLISLAEIFVSLTEASRALGYANYFTRTNIGSPYILDALGFSGEDIRTNLADYRYRLNSIIYKLKAFAIPKVFNYFDERISQFGTIYADDADVINAQYFAFTNAYEGVFDPTNETGGAITFEDAVSKLDFNDFLSNIERRLEILRQNEDMNIISGDILKAYGEELFSLDPIPVDFELLPIHDPLVELQVQNGHYLHDVAITNLEQEGNQLNAYLSGNCIISQSDRYLNSPVFNPDPNMIFALSKFQLTIEDGYVSSGNTTVLLQPYLYEFSENREFLGRETQLYVSAIDLHSMVKDLEFLTKFSAHPYVYVIHTDDADREILSLPIGDMQSVARLAITDTKRMNDARFILSFQTKQMG